MKPRSAVEAAEPAWEVAYLFPPQGTWSEEEYLTLQTNHLIEFSHGYLEVLPMPTEAHQFIVAYLYHRLSAFLRQYRPKAMVLFAPLPVRLWAGKYREPDVVLMLAEHADRRHQQYWEGPDLVMEVVSSEYRRHDLETKRREYAQAGIPEYWIVDPDEEQITVLTLKGKRYAAHGVFEQGMVARSALLAGFEVAVDEVGAAARQ